MLDPETRRRLSKVNRERLPSEPLKTESPSQVRPPTLNDLIPGRVEENELGRFFILERGTEDLQSKAGGSLRASMETLRKVGYSPEETLFLDIETCGLANCPLFLVGTMRLMGDEVRVEQFFARDYSEEPGMLLHISRLIPSYRLLVTFNGRTFDVPYIRDRMVLYRLDCGFTKEHLDLLPKARRRWRGQFPNCRLQTLEQNICGRRRFGDTPGNLIPQVYHDFVKTGNAAPMEGVFYHNALDLVTMAELLPSIFADE